MYFFPCEDSIPRNGCSSSDILKSLEYRLTSRRRLAIVRAYAVSPAIVVTAPERDQESHICDRAN